MKPNLVWIISLGSILVWLLIPLRQRKSFYFYYFLVLGLSDPVGYALTYLFNVPFLLTYLAASVLSLILLLKTTTIKKYLPLLVITFISLITLIYIYIYHGAVEFVFFITHIIILIRLSYLLILFVAQNQSISLFHLVLVLYETMVLSKFVNNFTQFAEAINLFIFSTGVQILVGIFFLIFKEQDHRIVFHLK